VGRMALEGAIDTAILAGGTVEDVQAEVIRVMEILKPGGGYICCPDQGIPGVPPENLPGPMEHGARGWAVLTMTWRKPCADDPAGCAQSTSCWISYGPITQGWDDDTQGKLLLEKPSPLMSAFYVARTGVEMMTFGARSADNGRTWTSAAPQPDFDGKLPANFRRSYYPGFVDPVNGNLLAVLFCMDREDIDRNVVEPEETGLTPTSATACRGWRQDFPVR